MPGFGELLDPLAAREGEKTESRAKSWDITRAVSMLPWKTGVFPRALADMA